MPGSPAVACRHHYDFYRLGGRGSCDGLDLAAVVGVEACVIEWPTLAPPDGAALLPAARLAVVISRDSSSSRTTGVASAAASRALGGGDETAVEQHASSHSARVHCAASTTEASASPTAPATALAPVVATATISTPTAVTTTRQDTHRTAVLDDVDAIRRVVQVTATGEGYLPVLTTLRIGLATASVHPDVTDG